jgi:hypothetical protein
MDRRIRTALVLAVLAGSALAAQAEERTIQAGSRWEGRARVYVTGPRQAFMLGSFAGRLAVEKEPSLLDGAQLVCPAAIDADYGTNTQRGEGRCVITAASGDRLFARWTCTGEPDKGCAGRFVLTGGTGAYQGVTGDGDFALRLALADLVRFERLEADYDLAGVASWPALRYRTP